MPDQNRRLEARTPDRAEAAQPDVGRDRVGIPAQVGSAQSIVLLRQQACAELFALRSTLASQGDVGGAVPRQLTSLARTIARIGSTAQRLESEVAQVRHHAYHDALTGLPNRGLLLDRFDRALAQAARRDGHVAVLMFDLDDFKLVNDRFGHRVGDQLLQGVARRLEGAARDADTVCRYGGLATPTPFVAMEGTSSSSCSPRSTPGRAPWPSRKRSRRACLDRSSSTATRSW